MDLLTPSSPGVHQLTTNSSWLPWGRVALISTAGMNQWKDSLEKKGIRYKGLSTFPMLSDLELFQMDLDLAIARLVAVC